MKYVFLFLAGVIGAFVFTNFFGNTEDKQAFTTHFETQVEREVAHDFWQATLFIQYENTQLAEAQHQTQQVMNQAMAILKDQTAIQIEDSRLQSFVRYNDDNQQNGWSVSGQIIIRTKNAEALGLVLEKLNGVMAIQAMTSGISSEKLMSLEDDMVKEALAKFEQKAQVIVEGMNAKNYRIENLKIITPSERQARPYMLARSASNSVNVFNEQKTTVHASVEGEIKISK